MSEWYEREIEELKTNRNYWRKEYYKIKESLENDNAKLNDKLISAEYRISGELEPRLSRERASYDSFVTSGGNDECFHNGDSGKCGFECSIFGEHDECCDGMTNKELLKAYADGYNTENVLDEKGLSIQKWLIDIKAGKDHIKSWKKTNRMTFKYITDEIKNIIINKLKGGK